MPEVLALPMTAKALFKEINDDLERYCYRLNQSKPVIMLINPCFQAGAIYRIRHVLNSQAKHKYPLWWPVIALEVLFTRVIEIISGHYLDPRAHIGSGLFLVHFGGVVIGAQVALGANCDIYQGVTLGNSGRGEQEGSPHIGDRVAVTAGAKVIGKLTIGSDVLIGANAVVTRSIPDRAVVVGIPAKIVSYKGSFDYVTYSHMEQDEERNRSLALVEAEQRAFTTPSARSGDLFGNA